MKPDKEFAVPASMYARCIDLDRDGTLIEHVPYLCREDQVRILPGVREGLAMLRNAGCMLCLHTNQSGVGRGYFGIDEVLRCNDAMIEQLGMGHDLFQRVCIAPEHPDGPPVYRKPSPKFGLELMTGFGLSAEQIFYMGDSVSDLLTASALKARGLGVNTGQVDLRQALLEGRLEDRFPVFDGFAEAATAVLEWRA